MAVGDPMSPRKRSRDDSEEQEDRKQEQGADVEGG